MLKRLAGHDCAMLQLRLGKPECFRKIMLKKIKHWAVAVERVTKNMINCAELAEQCRVQLVDTYRAHKRK